MKTSYTVSIKVARSATDVFEHLTHDIDQYWPEELEGECTRLNDEFIFRTGTDHYSKNKVTVFVPGHKLVWLVTDSIRATDNFSWTGTQMIFELTTEPECTKLSFTYEGLVLEEERERLIKLCDTVIKERLYQLLT